MAKAQIGFTLDVRVSFVVNETEARALDALAGYGEDAFIQAFYDKLGSAYMKDHEPGLREFLRTIRSVVNPALASLDSAKTMLRSAVGTS